MNNQENIVYFDGICSMCNGFVNFLMKRDKHNRLHFASLQSSFAQDALPKEQTDALETVVLQTGSKIYTQSDAILITLGLLGGVWNIIIILRIIPKFMRDWTYRFIANRRYKWFGKRDTCRIPSAEEQAKILG